jgi:hypothetical protein
MLCTIYLLNAPAPYPISKLTHALFSFFLLKLKYLTLALGADGCTV